MPHRLTWNVKNSKQNDLNKTFFMRNLTEHDINHAHKC